MCVGKKEETASLFCFHLLAHFYPVGLFTVWFLFVLLSCILGSWNLICEFSSCIPVLSSPPPPACQSPQLCPLSDLTFLQTYSRLFILQDMEETRGGPFSGSRFTAELKPGSSAMCIQGRAPDDRKLSILFTSWHTKNNGIAYLVNTKLLSSHMAHHHNIIHSKYLFLLVNRGGLGHWSFRVKRYFNHTEVPYALCPNRQRAKINLIWPPQMSSPGQADRCW